MMEKSGNDGKVRLALSVPFTLSMNSPSSVNGSGMPFSLKFVQRHLFKMHE